MQERSIIQKDFYRESGRWLSGIDIIKRCFSPNLHFVYLLRKAQKYQHTFLLKSIWKFILRHYQIKYGFQIYPETTIGEGFYLGHWGSLVINPKTVIGKNCNIAQGVTIGQQNRGKNAGAPTIGNHVWIGTNAVIVGNIKVGNDVLIAPNSYVNFNVPDHSIVSGNPATIVSRENATNGYINNVV